MSNYQENCLFEESSLLNLKVSDFLNAVCSNYNEDNEKTIDNFIENLIQLLLKFSDLLPLYKLQLTQIVRFLVDFGIKTRSNLFFNESDLNRAISSSNQQKHAYSVLYNLDKKICEVQNVKMLIYNDLFKSEVGDLNIKFEAVENSCDKECNSPKICGADVFNATSVEKLAQLVKKQSQPNQNIPQTDNVFHPSNYISGSSDCNNQKCIKEEQNPILVTYDEDKNEGSTSSKHFVNIHNLPSPIICTKVYEDKCIAGCENGQLQLFNLESGKLIDNIQAHSMTITSLVVWNNIIITCSLDKSLKSFNLKKNSTKRALIEHPIETASDDSNGVLYAGTSNGKIFRFNLLSMTQIGLMFHISSSKILSMKLFYSGFKLLMVVSAVNKPIAIRNAESGTLLKTLQINDIISFDVCKEGEIWFGISQDVIYSVPLNKSGEIKNIPNNHLSRVCTNGDSLIVCGTQGSLYIYDKALVLQQVLSVGFKDDITSISIWKHFVIISFKHTRKLQLLNLLH